MGVAIPIRIKWDCIAILLFLYCAISWCSSPSRFRPLEGRLNVILTSNPSSLNLPADYISSEKVAVASSLTEAINNCQQNAGIESIFVMGGESLYKEAVEGNESTEGKPLSRADATLSPLR